MRYVLDLGHGAGGVNFVLDNSTDYNTGRDVAGDATVAEASIIAWALNKVAEGKQLAIATVEPELSAGPYRAIELYDGPTDGVAP